MSFHRGQFRDLITRTLETFDEKLLSDAAVELLLGTAAAESLLGRYLVQVRGPAVGVFQMEPATFEWLKKKYEGRYRWLKSRFAAEMEWDLRLAVFMARLRYLAVPDPLPAADDIEALGKYWKAHYNTAAGAGTVDGFVRRYNDLVA